VYAGRRLSIDPSGKTTEGLHQGQNRTRENRPSGIAGGLWKRGDHGRRSEAIRETDGFAALPYHYARATFLYRLRPKK